MGVAGWNLIADNVELIGTVEGHKYSGGALDGDDDWCITIKPASGFERIAMSNHDGMVECEIRTPIDDENSEKVQFGELMHKLVIAVGCWCKDVSHDNKTELHPLQLLIWDSGPTNGQQKRCKVMVFSDHSPRFMVIPPRPSPLHRDQSTHATFRLNFPTAPHDDVAPVFSIASERNMTDRRIFNVDGGTGAFQLRGDILSGHGDTKGYYRGYIDLTYNTSRQPSYVGLLRPVENEHWGFYGADPKSFFKYLDNRFKEGIPATKLRSHVINGTRVWSAEFDRNGRGAFFEWYISWDKFVSKYDELRASMNLVDLETHVDNGQRFWTALWYNKTSDDGWARGSLEYVLGVGHEWGVPPITLKTFVEGGRRQWFGVFRATEVPTEVQPALSWEELLALHRDPSRAIVHIEPYIEAGVRKWAVIVEQRANDVTLTWWANRNQYRDEVQRLFDTYGLHVVDFAICRGWS